MNIYPLKVQAYCLGHTPQLSEKSDWDSELIGFVSLLVVNEREEGVVTLHLPIGPLNCALG